jgi:phage terminase large subunit GpA-like protein
LVKPVRVGYSTPLTGAIASFVANEPRPVLVLLPTEAHARGYIVSDIEPIFAAMPTLRGALAADAEEGERNTPLSERFAGGSLKIAAARSPRNLRRHTARVLIVDEADACEAGIEGNPIRLAERWTLSFPSWKIVIGSTPLYAGTSRVLRAYDQSGYGPPVHSPTGLHQQLSADEAPALPIGRPPWVNTVPSFGRAAQHLKSPHLADHLPFFRRHRLH